MRHIGVSNFTPQHIQELMNETTYGIQGAFVQMEIHPWYWRDAVEIETRFVTENLNMVGYALLAEGKLLGDNCPQILDEIGERLGITRVQVVLAWGLTKKWGVLVRSVDVSHLQQNLDAPSFVGVLTPQDCAAIDAISSLGEEEKLCWDPRKVI